MGGLLVNHNSAMSLRIHGDKNFRDIHGDAEIKSSLYQIVSEYVS
jgi:hypothetical protein